MDKFEMAKKKAIAQADLINATRNDLLSENPFLTKQELNCIAVDLVINAKTRRFSAEDEIYESANRAACLKTRHFKNLVP